MFLFFVLSFFVLCSLVLWSFGSFFWWVFFSVHGSWSFDVFMSFEFFGKSLKTSDPKLGHLALAWRLIKLHEYVKIVFLRRLGI